MPSPQYFQALLQFDIALLVLLVFQVKLMDRMRDSDVPAGLWPGLTLGGLALSCFSCLRALAVGPSYTTHVLAVGGLAAPIGVLSGYLAHEYVLAGLRGRWRVVAGLLWGALSVLAILSLVTAVDTRA